MCSFRHTVNGLAFCTPTTKLLNGKFNGGVLLPDGRVVFVPKNFANVGLFDPSSNTFTSGPNVGSEQNKFAGGALLLSDPDRGGGGRHWVRDLHANEVSCRSQPTLRANRTPFFALSVAATSVHRPSRCAPRHHRPPPRVAAGLSLPSHHRLRPTAARAPHRPSTRAPPQVEATYRHAVTMTPRSVPTTFSC